MKTTDVKGIGVVKAIKDKYFKQGLSKEKEDALKAKQPKKKTIKKLRDDKPITRTCSCGRKITILNEPVICECGIKHIR